MQYKTERVPFVRNEFADDERVKGASDEQLAEVIANARSDARARRKVRRWLHSLTSPPVEDAPVEQAVPAPRKKSTRKREEVSASA